MKKIVFVAAILSATACASPLTPTCIERDAYVQYVLNSMPPTPEIFGKLPHGEYVQARRNVSGLEVTHVGGPKCR